MGNGSTLPVARGSVDLFSFFIEFIERKRWRTVDSKAVRPELTQYVSRPAYDYRGRRRRYVYRFLITRGYLCSVRVLYLRK